MACWVGFQLPIRNTRLVQSKFHSIHGHMASFPNGAIRFALLMNLANGMQYTRTRPVPSSYTIAITCVQLVPSLSHSRTDRVCIMGEMCALRNGALIILYVNANLIYYIIYSIYDDWGSNQLQFSLTLP